LMNIDSILITRLPLLHLVPLVLRFVSLTCKHFVQDCLIQTALCSFSDQTPRTEQMRMLIEYMANDVSTCYNVLTQLTSQIYFHYIIVTK
jgi:hypothetical protein